MAIHRSALLPLLYCALFAALSGVLSQVSLPLGPVPIVMTQFSVFLAAALLGWKWGILSQIIFAALGAIGLPVFSGFSGGPAVLLGPTGGYIAGYLLAAAAVGVLLEKADAWPSWTIYPVLALGALLIYLPGVAWLMRLRHLDLVSGITLGMLPYLPGDALKVLLAGALIPVLRKRLPLFAKNASHGTSV